MEPSQSPDTRTRARLYEVVRGAGSFESTATEALGIGNEYLGTATGFLARTESGEDRWRVLASTGEDDSPGPLDSESYERYGRRIVKTASQQALTVVTGRESTDGHDGALYVGTPLILDGEPAGAVCFVANEPRPAGFSDDEQLFAELVGQLLERELSNRDREQALRARQAEVEERERAVERAYEVIADPDMSDEEQIDELLRVVSDAVDTEYATLSRIEGDTYEFEMVTTPPGSDVSAGDTVGLETTSCERVVETTGTLVLNDIGREAPDLAAREGNQEMGISCYLGAPVTVGGEVYGTFCFYGTDVRVEEFTSWEVTFVDLLSDWVGSVLERRQIETELRAERDLIEGIVETSPVGIMVVGAGGEVSFVNERAVEICGWPRDALDEFVYDDDRLGLCDEDGTPVEPGETLFERVVEGGDPIRDHVVGIRTQTGRRVWLSVNGAPQYDETDTLERAVFAFRDITEQRQLETELEEIFGRVTDAFYALDDEFRFTHVNRRAEELLQATEAELLGKKLWEKYPEAAELDDVWDAYHTALDTQEPQSFERYYEPLEFWVEATVHPSESGLSVYFRDITDRKEREQELEQQNERLEQFASVISHDLRNPLNVIELQLELARDEHDSEHLAAVENARRRMETLVENLLTLARESDSVDETELVDLDTVVAESWETVQTTDARLVRDTEGCIEANRSQLKQVFENLFRNAVEHGSGAQAGETGVTLRVGDLADGFYVEDDGPGIPADERDRVFEVGHTTEDDGTGFGLSIVERVIEAHGWTVSVTDGTDGGARFEITGVETGLD